MVFKIIKKLFILIAFLVYSALILGVGFFSYPKLVSDKPVGANSITQVDSYAVWTEFQNYRHTFNMELLIREDALCVEAMNRAKHSIKSWSHDGYKETSDKLAKEHNYLYTGENLSSGIEQPYEIIHRWSVSPKHREIMDNKQIKYGCIMCSSSNCALLTAY